MSQLGTAKTASWILLILLHYSSNADISLVMLVNAHKPRIPNRYQAMASFYAPVEKGLLSSVCGLKLKAQPLLRTSVEKDEIAIFVASRFLFAFAISMTLILIREYFSLLPNLAAQKFRNWFL
jgi:hypothetical protein